MWCLHTGQWKIFIMFVNPNDLCVCEQVTTFYYCVWLCVHVLNVHVTQINSANIWGKIRIVTCENEALRNSCQSPACIYLFEVKNGNTKQCVKSVQSKQYNKDTKTTIDDVVLGSLSFRPFQKLFFHRGHFSSDFTQIKSWFMFFISVNFT